MSASEWATTAIVVALWLGAGIPLAWRTVRAMRRAQANHDDRYLHPPGLFNVETTIARARAGVDPCGWCPPDGPFRPQCAEYVELAERYPE